MQAVKPEGTVEEVGRGFAGASNAAEFHHVLWDDAHFIERRNDLAGNGVMAAPLAQGAGHAAVIVFGQAHQIDLNIATNG